MLYASWPAVCASSRQESDRAAAETDLDAMIKTLDLAIILAGAAGNRRGRPWIDRAFVLLEEVWQAYTTPSPLKSPPDDDERPSKRPKTSDTPWQDTFSSAEPFAPPVTRPVRRIADISFEDFQVYLTTREPPNLGPLPLVITDLISAWPALTIRPWRSPSYLLSRTFAGRRLVPVELGRSYVDEGWGQQILPFGAFLASHITAPSDKEPTKTGYLAQHPLLTRTPLLLLFHPPTPILT